MSEADGPPSYPTPAQAVEAGLYYFAREDYPAARKWWEYALAIDPHNVRAHECLRILGRTLGEPMESMDVRRVTSADLAPRTASADIPVDEPIADDDPPPDDEPTEAVSRSALRGSPAEAWSRPATSARPQPAPIAPASAWSEGLEPVDSRRPRGPDPPAGGAVDAWSRPASSARPAPEARPAGGAADTWTRPSRPSEAPARHPAPGQAAETWTRPARPSQAPAPREEPASPVSVWSRPIAPAVTDPFAAPSRRPDAATEQVSARRPGVGPPEVVDAPASSRTGALPPLPPGAKPLPVGAVSARPSPAPVNSLPIASGDLGRYPSMPHRPPADDPARPSVLRFDPLGFEGTASWGAPAAEASSLDRWSRPSGPAQSVLPASPASGLAEWDPGEQARIDGGGAAPSDPPDELRVDPLADPGWAVAVEQLAALGGPTDRADILPPVDTFPLTADLVARGAGPEEISAARAMRSASSRGAPLPVPPLAEPSSRPAASSARPAIDVTDRRVEPVPTPKGGVPRLGPAPSTADLRRATAMAGIPTADLRRTVGQRTADVAAPTPAPFDPFGPPSEAPAPREAAPTPPPSDPFGALLDPVSSAPTARDVPRDPRPPSGDLRPPRPGEARPPSGDLRPGRPPSGDLRPLRGGDPQGAPSGDPRATFDPFAPPAPAVTWGAGSARPPSVFSTGTPLPEPRTFSVDLDDRSGAAVVTAEELMGDPAPPPRAESGDFDVIVEEPEEAPSPPTALEFALSAFESASEPDIIAVAPRPSSPTLQPWDDGPAETSHVTIAQDQHESDAVAELTPLPVLDRAPLFQLAGTPPPVMVPPREARPSPAPTTGDMDEPSQLFERARSRFLLHDFDGALELLERIPPHHPVHEQAKDVLAETRARLDGIYTSKIGGFDAVPRVLLSGEQLIWLNLNHRAGFILSQIDGSVTYEDLISLSGMPRLDTLRILCTLLQEGVIGTD